MNQPSTSSSSLPSAPAVGTPCAVTTTISSAISAGAPTMAARLFRDGVQALCATPKACPGTSSAAPPYAYNTYTFTNNSGASQCVTASLEALTSNIQLSVYSTSFDPANICTNYLADPGLSTGAGGTVFTTFTVANGADFVVVVNDPNGSSGTGGSYTLAVGGCGSLATATVTPTGTLPTATSTTTATATNTATATRTGTTTATNTATATSGIPTMTLTVLPSLTVTVVPPTSTATSTTTITATATATACPTYNFSDVQPSDYFYVPVQYLACHGVIGGYSDGTYRPTSFPLLSPLQLPRPPSSLLSGVCCFLLGLSDPFLGLSFFLLSFPDRLFRFLPCFYCGLLNLACRFHLF